MSIDITFMACGGVLLGAGLAADRLRKTPLTLPMVYLACGLILGPSLLAWFHFNPLRHAASLELVAEIAVLISLYTAAMKMPAPIHWSRWNVSWRLALLGMLFSVMLMTGFLHAAVGLPLGAAVLLAAILSPTDPVLATEVQVRRPGDRERLRFGLTSEGGLNDGAAFPFVMLGLGLLGVNEFGGIGQWLLQDVLYATAIALLIGWVGGGVLALLAYLLRSQPRPWSLHDDFLGLGLIGFVYGLCLMLDSWAFLGVFFAALSLRHHEARLSNYPQRYLTDTTAGPKQAQVSQASLAFKEQLERLCEVALVLMLGFALFQDSWSWRAVGVAAFLFFVARPLSVYLCTIVLRQPPRIRFLSAWFGVRGIGSLYYLAYAVNHGVPEELALELIHITLVVVALSIVVHGLSLRPLLRRYGRKARRIGLLETGGLCPS